VTAPARGGLRAGIVGTGFIGAVHAHAVRAAGATVQRVAASTPERSTEAARRLGAVAATSVEALIEADDVDVVHICTPNSLHVPQAARALKAGKHVVCEKPLATDLGDARSLAAQAEETGLVAAVPFVYRFYPMVREARARVAAGQGGPLHLLHGSYLQDWQAGEMGAGWRGEPEEGGEHRAFADIGVHWCDLVEFTTGHRLTRLLARTSGGGTHSAVLFETDQGAAGSVVVSQTAVGRKNRLAFSLDAAEASFGFDQENPEILQVGGIGETRVLHRGGESQSGSSGRLSVLPPGHPQGYQDCFNAFVADTYTAIRAAAPEGLPTFADGVRAAALTAAVIESATTSTWVEVPG